MWTTWLQRTLRPRPAEPPRPDDGGRRDASGTEHAPETAGVPAGRAAREEADADRVC